MKEEGDVDKVLECPHCKMKIKVSELAEWVGCDACNDGECWLKGLYIGYTKGVAIEIKELGWL